MLFRSSLGTEDLDIPDSEAPTPPPSLDHPDLVLYSLSPDLSPSSPQIPSTSNKSSPNTSHGDISSSEVITIETTDDDRSRSPQDQSDNNNQVNSKRSKEQDSSPTEQKTKKFKQLFGSDDEAIEEEESEDITMRTKEIKQTSLTSLQQEDSYVNNFSPISSASEDEMLTGKVKDLRNVGFAQAMDLSKREPVKRDILSQPIESQSQVELQASKPLKSSLPVPRRDQDVKN